jgi:hypothetical protein
LGRRGASIARFARAWGDHNWAGIRRRAADDPACDAANRGANWAAYDSAGYRAASSARHGAVAIRKSKSRQTRESQGRKSDDHPAHHVLLDFSQRYEENAWWEEWFRELAAGYL